MLIYKNGKYLKGSLSDNRVYVKKLLCTHSPFSILHCDCNGCKIKLVTNHLGFFYVHCLWLTMLPIGIDTL